MSILSPQDLVTSAVQRRALGALSLLAVFASLGVMIFWLQTRAIESSAQVVNSSGRQRMLSQRTALLAESLVDASTSTGAAEDVDRLEPLRDELRRLIEEMNRAHHGLLHGDEDLHLPGKPPQTVQAIYEAAPHQLHQQMGAYIERLREILQQPADAEEALAEVRRTVSEGELLASLDAVVVAFQKTQESRVVFLQRAEAFVFLTTLCLLGWTFFAIIRPMVRQADRHIHELREREQRLRAQSEQRLAAEEALRGLQEKLAHVTRLSTMGEMTAAIAHEVNQPLGAISLYAQAGRRMLASDAADIEEQINLLGRITDQAHRAGEVIRRIRALSTRGDSSRQICDINTLVQDAVKLAETYARFRDVRIDKDLAQELPEVFADPIQIQQVLLNLITNGVDATSPGESQPIEVRTRSFAHAVFVEVADHGPGLSPEIEDKLFQPFYTTKDSGMGMGLSISRSIVDSHGGRLEYRNRPEGGAAFLFTLPPADEVTVEVETVSAPT